MALTGVARRTAYPARAARVPGFALTRECLVAFGTDGERPLSRRSATQDVFQPAFVHALFEEMSATYGIVNYISSFGFCERWRRQCVARAELSPGMTVVDLMTGTGECWPHILRAIGAGGRIVGVDYTAQMCRKAEAHARRRRGSAIEVREEDALDTALPAGCADAVVACFAVKTLDAIGLQRFSGQVARLLKPGGRYALLEISDPRDWPFRGLYLFYLRTIVPLIGWAALGNPDNYRMLSAYTEAFVNSARLKPVLEDEGLSVVPFRVFWGCATGIAGRKPGRAAES